MNSKNSSLRSRVRKSTPRAFLKRVQNTLHKHHLLLPESRILVAVSGGPDSMALLHTLHSLQKNFDWELSVAHVNYCLRGKESDLDAALVKKTAEKLGLPFYLLTRKAARDASEEALRDVRYQFFERLVRKCNFDTVALAHHQDDQAETVLMRLLRGSGLLGLSAMRMKRGLYVRPFLTFSKQEILNFVQQSNIPYRLDKSNTKNIYLRNKIRNELVPVLEKYNPKIKQVLANTALTLQEDYDARREQTLTPLFITQKRNVLSFPFHDWEALSKNQKAALLRSLFQKQGLRLPQKSLVETILQNLAILPKKGFNKEYSRLKLTLKNDMIHVHFKELD